MVVFLDTNVILDAYFERPAHEEAAGKVMNLCATKRITGCVSTGVLADTVFIAQHIIKSEDHRKIIPFLCRMFDIVSADRGCMVRAAENTDMRDFEDAIRAEEAILCGADYLVTSNVKDYKKSAVKAFTPEDFLSILQDIE